MLNVNLEYIHGYLAAISALNNGVNCSSDYSIQVLPFDTDLRKTLERLYDGISGSSLDGGNIDPWNINIKQIFPEQFKGFVEKWFFHQSCSPQMHKDNTQNCVETFLSLLPIALYESCIYHIYTNPPVFYECVWDDFVLAYRDSYYFLHFGISD